jgi:hypothetical protein
MSALGQKQAFGPRNTMSALPPKADIVECDCHVRFVPKADILRCGKECRYSNISSAAASSDGGMVMPSAVPAADKIFYRPGG